MDLTKNICKSGKAIVAQGLVLVPFHIRHPFNFHLEHLQSPKNGVHMKNKSLGRKMAGQQKF